MFLPYLFLLALLLLLDWHCFVSSVSYPQVAAADDATYTVTVTHHTSPWQHYSHGFSCSCNNLDC